MAVKPNSVRRSPQSGFVPLKTADERTDRNFYEIQRELEAQRSVMTGAKLHEGIVPSGASATLTIQHGLGRPYRGWLLVRNEDDADLSEDTTNKLTDRFLMLTYSGAATNKLSILVF